MGKDYSKALGDAVEGILGEIKGELYDARRKFPKFNSEHEGYAVIKEEVDELWDEIKRKTSTSSHEVQRKENMRKEVIQIAAMAIRFIMDRTDKLTEGS